MFLTDFKEISYIEKPHHGDQFLLAYLKGPYQGPLVNPFWNGKRHCDVLGVGEGLAWTFQSFYSYIDFFIIKTVFQEG